MVELDIKQVNLTVVVKPVKQMVRWSSLWVKDTTADHTDKLAYNIAQ